jgi:hypothetical protein
MSETLKSLLVTKIVFTSVIELKEADVFVSNQVSEVLVGWSHTLRSVAFVHRKSYVGWHWE